MNPQRHERYSTLFNDDDVHQEMGNFNDQEDNEISPYLRKTGSNDSGMSSPELNNNAHHDGEKTGQRAKTWNTLETRSSDYGTTHFDHRQNRNSYLSVEGALEQSGSNSASPTHTVTRRDIRASAERILYAYLIPGAEREISLPPHLSRAIQNAIEVEGRDDPQVFDEARDYIFQAMEREAFPGFLRAKALGNLVPLSSMLRLIIGLLCLMGAFWTGFSMILLNYSRVSRVWVLLPFVVATYCLFAHQYELDPLLALGGVSESTFFSFTRIRDPYVRRLLNRRALWVLFLAVLVAGLLTVIFATVPSTRL